MTFFIHSFKKKNFICNCIVSILVKATFVWHSKTREMTASRIYGSICPLTAFLFPSNTEMTVGINPEIWTHVSLCSSSLGICQARTIWCMMLYSSFGFFRYGSSWGPWRGVEGGNLWDFTLDPDENIVSVNIRSGLYIDSLQVGKLFCSACLAYPPTGFADAWFVLDGLFDGQRSLTK